MWCILIFVSFSWGFYLMPFRFQNILLHCDLITRSILQEKWSSSWLYWRTECSYYGQIPWWLGHRSFSSLELELCISHYSLVIYGQLFLLEWWTLLSYLSLVMYGQLFVSEIWTLSIIHQALWNLHDKSMELFGRNIYFLLFSNKLNEIIIFTPYLNW